MLQFWKQVVALRLLADGKAISGDFGILERLKAFARIYTRNVAGTPYIECAGPLI